LGDVVTAPLPWVYDDGGRAAAGYEGSAGDCVTRAIAIAAELPYQEVYDALWERIRSYGAREWARVSRKVPAWRGTPVPKHYTRSPRDGVNKDVYKPFLRDLGWVWTPTMGIGTGTTVHLAAGELPAGRVLAQTSKHLVAVIDGTIRDTHDPSRDGSRCVYGYHLRRS
jgi:hypothetical protein